MKIKKIHLAFLITALLVVGAGLLYPRGGGGGLDPWGSSEAEQILPVQVKPATLPEACPVDQAIDPLQESPQISKRQSTACTVEFPVSLQVVPYCANKTAKLGAANITLPQGTSQFLNIPKNCSILMNDEKLYAKTIVCSGPAGSKVNIIVQNSCTPPAANLPDVEPSCPPDYSRGPEDPACHYNPPAGPFCGDGYLYDESAKCCRDASMYPWDVSACPEGYQLVFSYSNSVLQKTFCQTKAIGASTTDTRSYTVTLGSCNEKKPIQSDKPQSCIIDPATGACK
jgi:hypothetical protein